MQRKCPKTKKKKNASPSLWELKQTKLQKSLHSQAISSIPISQDSPYHTTKTAKLFNQPVSEKFCTPSVFNSKTYKHS